MSTRYVWEKWNRVSNVVYDYNYTTERLLGYSTDTQLSTLWGTLVLGNSFRFSESNGNFIIESPRTVNFGFDNDGDTYNYRYASLTIRGGYGGNELLVDYPLLESPSSSMRIIGDYNRYSDEQSLYVQLGSDGRKYSSYTTTAYSKGSTSYGNATSSSSSAYPNNNYSGSYWYVLKGTDSIDPTAVTYPSPLFRGQTVRVTVTPVSPTYGGTIRYKYEYTTNGSTWTVANSGTTATSVNITIPADATTFQARVTASDDTGFTSTTAITGTSLPVYNIDPTAVTYNEDDLSVGNDITVSITAANSGYTGTVTYIIQTNVNGTGWEYETESTSTNVPLTIPSDAVSWAVRVQAKAEDYTSSTYVYGNGHTEGVAVKQTAGFNIVPENKHLGYLGSETLMQYYVSTENNASYTCVVTLDGETVSSTTATPGLQTLTLDSAKWEALSSAEEHTITIAATCNGKSITRTYLFNKFVYDPSTLPGLLDGVAEAIKVKMGTNRSLWGYRLPMEILKITNSEQNYILAYIDVTATYVSGMTIMAVSSSGEVYSSAANASGTTRLEVLEKGDYIVSATIGDVSSESKKV